MAIEYRDLSDIIELKNRLETEKMVKYTNEALSILGLNVGDKTFGYFPMGFVRDRQGMCSSVIAECVIKKDERGIVYLESCSPINQCVSVWNGKYGRARGSIWVERPSIQKQELIHIKIPITP